MQRALSVPLPDPPVEREEDDAGRLPLIGRSPAMQEIYRVVARLVGVDLTVTITGESGTGKELIARALHDYGTRRNGPFVAINMAAIPKDLIEAELFGHERGAFTGASQRMAGRFEQAEGGTLFLDEIGDMPMEAQTRLLRVLQEGEYTRVGGRQPLRANVRIVAATHRDLRLAIRQGLFREDLFYRLNVVPLRVPPLRHRREDIAELVAHFLSVARREGLGAKTIDSEAMRRLRAYSWPGNVRELENLIRRIAALYPQDTVGIDTVEAELAEIAEEASDELPAGAERAESLAEAVDIHLRRHFRARRRQPSGGGPLRAHRPRGRAPADPALPGGNERQPDQVRGDSRTQPEHAAQEDPVSRNSGGSRFALMTARFESLSAVRRWAAFAFAGLAAFSGVLTYLAMTGAVPFIPPTVDNVVILLVVDLVLLVLLATIVGYRMAALWRERRRRRGGSQLHVRLAVLFTAVALVPTVLVALFTVLFFDYGLHGWFSQRVQTALDRSLAVAEAYVEEHRRVLVSDALAMANDLSRGGPLLFANTRALENVLESQAGARSLSDAQVLEAGGRVLARSMFSFGVVFSPVPEWALEAARRGEVAILEDRDGDRLGALLRIAGLDETFLYIGRYVDPIVVNQVTRVRSAVAEYESFEGQRTTIEYTFAMMFATVAALFVFAAIWVGFNMAAQLAEPIMNLISAANRVRGGDLTARVRVGTREGGEIDALSRAFNRMTDQLGRQRTALIDANLELEERRRFTEAVLAGVAVGVVGLDAGRRVHLPNRVASDLLGVDLTEHLDRPLIDVVPAFGAALEEASRRPDRSVETEVAIERNRELRTFQLRVTAEPSPDRLGGFVLTFADITDLQSAQRMAAWSDVARRIAHEIKNPLTPIQLAAERLRRRYAGEIKDDPETFSLCIDTIVRQVDDMRRMVDEFASFARMPAPAPAEADLADIVRRAVFLQREAATGLDIEMHLPDGPVLQVCDAQLLGQAITNLLLNAIQALENSGGGRILVVLRESPGQTEISVEDDGPGFPAELRHRLTEPYVTTKGAARRRSWTCHRPEDRRGSGCGTSSGGWRGWRRPRADRFPARRGRPGAGTGPTPRCMTS